jgi:hypothetical protein
MGPGLPRSTASYRNPSRVRPREAEDAIEKREPSVFVRVSTGEPGTRRFSKEKSFSAWSAEIESEALPAVPDPAT